MTRSPGPWKMSENCSMRPPERPSATSASRRTTGASRSIVRNVEPTAPRNASRLMAAGSLTTPFHPDVRLGRRRLSKTEPAIKRDGADVRAQDGDDHRLAGRAGLVLERANDSRSGAATAFVRDQRDVDSVQCCRRALDDQPPDGGFVTKDQAEVRVGMPLEVPAALRRVLQSKDRVADRRI